MKRKFLTLILAMVLVISLVIPYSVSATDTNEFKAESDEIEFKAKLEKTDFSLDELIELEVTLTNNSDATLYYEMFNIWSFQPVPGIISPRFVNVDTGDMYVEPRTTKRLEAGESATHTLKYLPTVWDDESMTSPNEGPVVDSENPNTTLVGEGTGTEVKEVADFTLQMNLYYGFTEPSIHFDPYGTMELYIPVTISGLDALTPSDITGNNDTIGNTDTTEPILSIDVPLGPSDEPDDTANVQPTDSKATVTPTTPVVPNPPTDVADIGLALLVACVATAGLAVASKKIK